MDKLQQKKYGCRFGKITLLSFLALMKLLCPHVSDHSCLRDGKLWAQGISRQSQQIQITFSFDTDFWPILTQAFATRGGPGTSRLSRQLIEVYSFLQTATQRVNERDPLWGESLLANPHGKGMCQRTPGTLLGPFWASYCLGERMLLMWRQGGRSGKAQYWPPTSSPPTQLQQTVPQLPAFGRRPAPDCLLQPTCRVNITIKFL